MIKMKFVVKTLGIVILLLGGLNIHAQERGVIIANISVPVDSMTSAELRSIYLGKQLEWKNHLKIYPTILKPSEEISKYFFKKIVEMTYRKFRRQWLRKVFSGSNPAPPVFSSVEEVLKYIVNRDGAIGYIPLTSATAELLKNNKVIRIDGKLGF